MTAEEKRIKEIEALRERYPYDIDHIRAIFDKGIEFNKSKLEQQIKDLKSDKAFLHKRRGEVCIERDELKEQNKGLVELLKYIKMQYWQNLSLNDVDKIEDLLKQIES